MPIPQGRSASLLQVFRTPPHPHQLHEYQDKGFTEFVIRKLLGSKDAILVDLDLHGAETAS